MLGKASKIGIYFLMISFGASFGFAVMGRISLLIGRFTDLISFTDSDYYYATYWVLVIIVGILGYAAYKDSNNEILQNTRELKVTSEEE